MAEREREGQRDPDGTAASRDYYDGVADGLLMAADYIDAQRQPLSLRLGPLP